MTSEDGNVNATVEELAALADDPQEDVAEEAAPSEDTETVKTEEDDSALSEADLSVIDKYEKMGEEDRVRKIEKMLSSGRSTQKAQAKMLMEAFDLEISETEKSDTDEAVAESLRKMGLDSKTISELKEQKEEKEKKEAIKDWAEKLGITATEVSRNKEFVKAFHKSDGSIQTKVDNAIKAFLKENSLPSAAKRKATLKLTTTGKSIDPTKTKGEVDLETLLTGKSLDEIDLSKL